MAQEADRELEAMVLASLRRNTFLRPLAIKVGVRDGIVTLEGSIDSELNRQAAEHEIRLIDGVKGVENHLTVIGEESSSRTDRDVAQEVREQIAADPTLEDASRFHIRVEFGRVFVSGEAESMEERESVLAAIQRVPGVEGIEDRMTVRVPMIGQRRES